MSREKVLYTTNIPSPYCDVFFNQIGKFADLAVVYERENAITIDAL